MQNISFGFIIPKTVNSELIWYIVWFLMRTKNVWWSFLLGKGQVAIAVTKHYVELWPESQLMVTTLLLNFVVPMFTSPGSSNWKERINKKMLSKDNFLSACRRSKNKLQ